MPSSPKALAFPLRALAFPLRARAAFLRALVAFPLLASWVQAESPLLAEIRLARDLVCELHAAERPRSAATSRLMLVIENVQAQSDHARVLTSASAGARPVRVYAGDTGVHFVEDVEASVKVTSVLSCTNWKQGKTSRQCMRYEAVNRWHFDTTVHRNPDQAFLRLAENSYTGWCEPWRMD